MANEYNGFTTKEILIRVEEKIDGVLQDHEKRLRGLEKWKLLVIGSAAAGGGTGAIAAISQFAGM